MKTLKKMMKVVAVFMVIALIIVTPFFYYTATNGHGLDGTVHKVVETWAEERHIAVPPLDLDVFANWVPKEGSAEYGDNVPTFSEIPHPEVISPDRHELIGTYGVHSTFVPFREISKVVVNALIAAEDERFWEHPGIDARGMARAAKNIALASVKARRLRIVGGGSTITQQLVKQFVLRDSSKAANRKVVEILLAWKLNENVSKERVLEIYLNLNEYGNRVFGLEEAARVYFGVSQKDLTPGQAALLAALQKSPTVYNPCRHPKAAEERRQYVLKRMYETNGQYHFFASDNEFEEARKVPEYRCETMRIDSSGYAPQFVRTEFERGMAKGSIDEKYTIFSSIHPRWQVAAEQALWNRLKDLDTKYKNDQHPIQGAMVVMDWRTRQVRAIVGGRENVIAGLNRAVDSWRQPGSSFKPFVYAAAFEAGFLPADQVLDRPTAYPDNQKEWSVKNHDGKFGHLVPGTNTVTATTTIYDCLARSVNVCAVVTAATSSVGIGRVLDMLGRVGIKSPQDPYLPTAIGGGAGVTPMELTNAYATIAAGGLYGPPHVIETAVDRNGQVVKRSHLDTTRVMTSSVAYMVRSILHGVVHQKSGTGRLLAKYDREGCEVVGKTGTTNVVRQKRVKGQLQFADGRPVYESIELDGYFCGIAGPIVACVRIGRDVNEPIAKDEGSRNAVVVFDEFLSRIKTDIFPCEPIVVPEGIELHPVDALGTLTTTAAADAIMLPFPVGYDFDRRPQPLAGPLPKPKVEKVEPEELPQESPVDPPPEVQR